MEIYIFRHGETLENREGIVQSQMNTRLSEKGIIQANELGKELRDKNLNFIYTSDLDRAYKTAEIVSSYQDNCFLIETSLLREADFRRYTGCKKSDFDWRNLSDIESQQELQDRLKKFYKKLHNQFGNTDKKIGISSHAGSIKALISILLGITSDKIWDLPLPENARYIYFNTNHSLEENKRKIDKYSELLRRRKPERLSES